MNRMLYIQSWDWWYLPKDFFGYLTNSHYWHTGMYQLPQEVF